MTLKVIPLLQAFSNAIRRTFVQYFTRFQLTARRAVPQRQLGFLFLQGSVSTLCGYVFHECIKGFFLLTAVQTVKIERVFPEL